MSQPNPVALDEVARTLQAYREASAAGRSAESEQLLVRVAERAPGHPAVLNELGVVMMSRNEYEKAYSLFSRAAQTDPGHAQLWSNLASSLRMLGRREEEREALERALSIEPRHVASLLQKASLFEDLGDARNAARTYQHALLSLPPDAVAPPTL
ncbi:MAG TPA: tetratricopeptide repeat protein, partial [Steroidobacteraceae bacterium]